MLFKPEGLLSTLEYMGCSDDATDSATDSLEHYLACPILWHMLTSATKAPASAACMSPVKRACLETPVQNDFKTLGIAFKCYHAIRLSHPELVNRAVRASQFDAIHEILLAHTRHFADEVSLRQLASD